MRSLFYLLVGMGLLATAGWAVPAGGMPDRANEVAPDTSPGDARPGVVPAGGTDLPPRPRRTTSPAPVPEPPLIGLFLLGCAMLGFRRGHPRYR